jgi:hypothetical protein
MGDAYDEPFCPNCGFHPRHSVSFRDAGDPLVTIIGFWPIEEQYHQDHDDRWISRCHYRTVCCHAHYDLQIIETPADARIPKGIPVIGLDEPYTIVPQGGERGTVVGSVEPPESVIELIDFAHPKSATYIFGNTHYQRPSDHFDCDHLIGVTMDDEEAASHSPFYGNQLVALIWYDRKLKGL